MIIPIKPRGDKIAAGQHDKTVHKYDWLSKSRTMA
jgi:hypothetical protein